MRYLLVALTLALLVVPSFGQETQVQSTAGATAIFYAGVPFEGGSAIVASSLDAQVTEDLGIQDAAYVTLIVRSASFVFMIDQVAAPGQTAGQTTVHLNGATRTLAEVGAELVAAMNGQTNLLVFTNGGPRDMGVAVAVINVSHVKASTPLPVAGSTHVTVIAHGQLQSFTIVSAGTTLATISVSADEDTMIVLAMPSDTDTLLNVLGLIGVGSIAP